MNNKVILLVEDNQSDIDLTRRAFKRHKISNELVVAEDGQEALDYVFGTGNHECRNVDDVPMLVLLDINLPRVGGIEVLRRIRSDERTRRVPVVMLTTSNERSDVAQSYDLGANSYIQKPVDFDKFAEAISSLGLYWLVLNEPPPDGAP